MVALRVAVEGAWMSLLAADPDPAGAAQRLGLENVAAIERLEGKTETADAVRAAVIFHTGQIWGSIAWQLAERARNEPAQA